MVIGDHLATPGCHLPINGGHQQDGKRGELFFERREV